MNLQYVKSQWDRVSALVAIAMGGILLLLGWFGVSGTAFPAKQIPYIISGGLGGIFLAGIGSVLWLSADLRDEWRKLDDIHRDLFDDGTERPGIEVPGAQHAISNGSSSAKQRRRPLTAET